MTNNIITAVGIDVSKGKSMIAIRHPGGEVLRIHRTEQPKQQKLKTIASTHSLFRVVQEVTGGEVWRGGVSFRSHFTPAKGQNFPKASRYLFDCVNTANIGYKIQVPGTPNSYPKHKNGVSILSFLES